jgi:hypothetical protein
VLPVRGPGRQATVHAECALWSTELCLEKLAVGADADDADRAAAGGSAVSAGRRSDRATAGAGAGATGSAGGAAGVGGFAGGGGRAAGDRPRGRRDRPAGESDDVKPDSLTHARRVICGLASRCILSISEAS